MFEAGTPSAADETPIAIQADAKHLEMILQFAHPALVSPKVDDVATLAQLLRIAKQYEMDGVLGQIREWFTKASVTDAGVIYPISMRDPLAAFVLAFSFDCLDEARYALREVIKCDLSQELGPAKNFEIPLYLLQQIEELRTERTAWYMMKVTTLSQAVILSCMNFNPNSSLSKSSAYSQAPDCARWQGSAMKALQRAPSFSTLKGLIYNSATHTLTEEMFKRSDVSSTVWQLMTRWEVEATELESKLPELKAIQT
jgi:hypothetical protein